MPSVEFYQQRAKQFQEEVSRIESTIRHYSISRLVVALSVIALVYLGFTQSALFYPIPLLVILFFFLVQRQLKYEKERELLLHLVNLNQWEAAATDYDFKNFPDGERFVDPHHPFSHDLDVFGKGSLFQYINRCATTLGENKLGKDLTNLKFSKESVLQRQEAIRELGLLVDFRQHCWAIGKQIHDKDFNLEPLWAWLKEPALFRGKKFFSVIRWVLPALTCLSLFGILFNPIFKSIFLFLFLAQLGINSTYNKPITKLQNNLSLYKIILENYSRIFQLMKVQSGTSSIMKDHIRIATEAAENVNKFSKLVNAMESRMNLIARVFGNGLFLYDFHSVSNLEEWREQHADSLPSWISSLSEWDALLSFATLHYNHPHYAFAEMDERLAISGKEIGHPLIHSRERIDNNFELGNPAGVMLITGANMAGKSTFLRTIGINYLLASNGSPVCATQWSSPLATLRSGMRTSDSLQEHQSYFYAELNRLQTIIEDLRAGKPMIILLDEILKGTNSTDKQTGSRELIKQLIQQKALVLLATHDIALGDMEQQYPDRIINTCFEGKIENDQLTFDYKLNQGLAQKANATFLMRKMGIIPPSNLNFQ
jgi:DNA mismatch repair ATPase MutS